MDEPFTREVTQSIKAWNPALIVIQWLKDLDHYNQQYGPLFEGLFKDKYDAIPLWGHAEGMLSEGEDPYPARFPLKLKQGTAIKLYQDLCQLKKLIEETEKVEIQQETLTPHQAFTTIDPLLATYYKWLREEYKKTLIHQGADQAYMTTGLELYKEGVRKKLEYLFNQDLLDNTLQSHLTSRKDSKAYLYREQPLQEAAIEVLDNIDLQTLIPLHRKQVLEEAFLSFPELITQVQHPQWQSAYLVHEVFKDKSPLSLSLLKALIQRFPQSLAMLDEEQGYAPLHYALENQTDRTILEFLLKAGVNVNQRTNPKVGSSFTPLDIACMKNKVDAFKLLVEYGATHVNPELAQKFSKILLPSSDAFNSFLALVSKHQELRWLLSLDHLFPPQEAGFKVHTARYGERGIHSELRDKVINSKGNIINVMPEGRHPVGKISLPFHNLRLSLYFKEYPELPGLEEAVASLMRMTFGFGAPYSELIKLEGKPVLVSQGIPGRTLKAILKENDSLLKDLEPYSTSSLILLSMLINPEDGKPDNYILEERPEGNRLIAIDNDHAFVKAVAKSKPSINLNWSSPVIQVKTILYCLDQMQEKVHPQAREQFLKLNVGEVLESWLRHLRALNAQYHELFTEPERVKYMKEKECYIGIPFQEGAIKELYQKMSRLQSLLHDKPHLTHLELLCQLEPYLGKRYKPAFESPLSVQARFDLIDKPFFSKDGKTITSSGHILSSMNIPLQESLLESAKRDLTKDKDYRPNKALEELKAIKQENVEAILKEQGISKLNLTNLKGVKLEDNLSQVLKKIDFKSIPEVDQKALFELLKQRPFKTLILKNAQALSNQFIQQHIMFDYLRELNLTGCLDITDDILPILAEKAPALEPLNLSYLPKIKNFMKNSFLKQSLSFNTLHSLNLSYCNGLESIRIDAPVLEKLKLESCMNVSSFNFTNMPDLKYIDLSRSKLIDIALLKTLIKASSEKIVSLKLEGCNKIEDRELWEAFPYLMTNYENELQRSKEGIKAHLLKVKIFEELDLKYSKIDINTFEIIFKAIWQRINTIQSLNLSSNDIEDREYLSNCVNSDNDVIIIEKGLTDGSREERDLI